MRSDFSTPVPEACKFIKIETLAQCFSKFFPDYLWSLLILIFAFLLWHPVNEDAISSRVLLLSF